MDPDDQEDKRIMKDKTKNPDMTSTGDGVYNQRPDSGYFSEITPTPTCKQTFYLPNPDEQEEEDLENIEDSEQGIVERLSDNEVEEDDSDTVFSSSVSHVHNQSIDIPSRPRHLSTGCIEMDNMHSTSVDTMDTDTTIPSSSVPSRTPAQRQIEEQNHIQFSRIIAQQNAQARGQRRVHSACFTSREAGEITGLTRDRSNSLPANMLQSHQELGRELRRIGDDFHQDMQRSRSGTQLSRLPHHNISHNRRRYGAVHMWQWVLQSVGLASPYNRPATSTTTTATTIGPTLHEDDEDEGSQIL